MTLFLEKRPVALFLVLIGIILEHRHLLEKICI